MIRVIELPQRNGKPIYGVEFEDRILITCATRERAEEICKEIMGDL